MAGVNKVIILGRLGRDPEIRSFQNGGRVVNLRIATSESWKDRNGDRQERTEWHTVAIFNEPLGEIAEKYLRKGDEVYLEGQLETRKWEDRDGQERYSTEVVLRPFRSQLALIGGKRDSGGDSRAGGSRDDDRGPPGRSGGNAGGGTRSGGWDSRGGGGTSGRRPAADLDDEIPFGACVD